MASIGALISRRRLLAWAATSGTAVLAACTAAAPTAAPAPVKPAEPAKPVEAPKPAEPTKPAAAEPAKPTADPAKPAAAAAPSTGGPTGEFVFASHNEWETYQQFTNAFFAERYPALKVRYDITPGSPNYLAKIQTQFAAGEKIDFLMMNEAPAIGLAKKGVLRALDEYKKSHPLLVPESELFQSSNTTWQGKQHMLMSGWTTYGVYYNKDVFDQAKMEYPPDKWTWEQLGEMAQKLTKDTNGDGKADVWGWCHWQLNALHTWTPVLYAYGGEHFSQDGGKAILNEPGGVAALDLMQKMWTQRKAVPPPADVSQMGGWSSVFMAGIAGISQIYSAFHDTVYKSSKGKFEWRIGRIPEGPAGRFMTAGGAGWSIPRSARLPDVAWEWARTQVSHLPTVKAVAAAGYTVAHFETMATAAAPSGELKEKLGGTWKQAMIDDLKTFGKPTYYSYVGTEYPQMVAAEMDSLVNGSKTPKQVADAIVAKATRMLEDNR